MVEYIIKMLKTVLNNSIGDIFQFYSNNGYSIKTFLVERYFECIHDSLPHGANLNTTAVNQHVPEIKSKSHIIKEYAQALISNFLFKKILSQIIIELIWFVGVWLGQKPSDNGVLYFYSPHNIIMGQDISYEKHYKFRFGYYVEAHEYFKIPTTWRSEQSVVFSQRTLQTFRGDIKYFP